MLLSWCCGRRRIENALISSRTPADKVWRCERRIKFGEGSCDTHKSKVLRPEIPLYLPELDTHPHSP